MTLSWELEERKPLELKEDERAAWDRYVASCASVSLSGWFRWKQGQPIDYKLVIHEVTQLADAFIEERRRR